MCNFIIQNYALIMLWALSSTPNQPIKPNQKLKDENKKMSINLTYENKNILKFYQSQP